jgi:hypothetical protein
LFISGECVHTGGLFERSGGRRDGDRSARGCAFRRLWVKAPASAEAVRPDSVRNRPDHADCGRAIVRAGAEAFERSRNCNHSSRHGGNDTDRLELRPNGALVPTFGLCLQLHWANTQSTSGVSGGLGHDAGLPADPSVMHHLWIIDPAALLSSLRPSSA